jgi:hypothetical protein
MTRVPKTGVGFRREVKASEARGHEVGFGDAFLAMQQTVTKKTRHADKGILAQS